nr:transcription factor GAMYB-like [Ipomoea batatas]
MNLKKAAFTPKETVLYIELHAKIKDYWNTKIKKRQRAGLLIYPPDVHLQAIHENNQNEDMSTFSTGDTHHSNLQQANYFEIPAVKFQNLEQNQQLHPIRSHHLHSQFFLQILINIGHGV